MRVNDTSACRVVRAYLDSEITRRFGETCSFDEARAIVDEACELFGMPGAISITDNVVDGLLEFRFAGDPLTPIFLASRILAHRKAVV
jgi:hypothetical protein